MKKLLMVLPLAVLLTYCSSTRTTQTSSTDMDNNSTASTTVSTTSDDMAATTTTDVNDVNTNTTTLHADRTLGNVTIDHSSSMINPIPNDPNDPMYQHWQRTNAQYWTYDYSYPGYTRPTGEYNSAISGNWSVKMTPSLVTAWRTDNSGTLWLRNGSTYLSASETFNTNNNMSTTDPSGTVAITGVNSINYNAYNGNMYQMPQLNIYLDNGSFTGYTGCNAISGRIEVTGTSIRFLNTTPSTSLDCMGGFDQNLLLDILKRIDSYAYVGNELQLMQGNEVLLTLNKSTNETTLK